MKKVLFALPLAAIIAATTSIFTSTAHAAPLALVGTKPDIFLDTGVATYTISGPTKTLTLTGITEDVTTLPDNEVVLSPTGTFTATVTLVTVSGTGASEVLSPVSGSLTVTGNSVTEFASSTPVAFGFQNVGSPAPSDIQIVFAAGTGALANGGDIAVSYHGLGGIAAYPTTFFDSNFTTSNIVKGDADVFNTPEPTSLALLGLAAPMLLRRRRHA